MQKNATAALFEVQSSGAFPFKWNDGLTFPECTAAAALANKKMRGGQ
jgi:hypothetical protein